MLYNLHKVQDKILKNLPQKGKGKGKANINNAILGKTLKSLTPEYLIENGIIDEVYFVNDHAPFFVDEKGIAKIQSQIIDPLNGGEKIIDIEKITRHDEACNAEKFKVNNFSDYKKVEDIFLSISDYADVHKKEKEEKKRKADANIRANNERVAKIRKETREKELEKTTLDYDFLNKRVGCIDLEFFIDRNRREKTKSHRITEVGFAGVYKNSKFHSHVLVKDYYELKVGRNLQLSFLFGKTEYITKDKIKDYVRAVIDNIDVLVLHEKREDLKALKEVGVDIEKEFPNIKIVDTQEIYRRYFSDNKKLGEQLSKIMDVFNVDYNKSKLHNAGNDSAYTLDLLFEMKKSYDLRNKKIDLNNIDGNVKNEENIDFHIEKVISYAKENNISFSELLDQYQKRNINNDGVEKEVTYKKRHNLKR